LPAAYRGIAPTGIGTELAPCGGRATGDGRQVARITAMIHRKGAIFQGLLIGKPIAENHVLK
jgi:hypothetical protein